MSWWQTDLIVLGVVVVISIVAAHLWPRHVTQRLKKF